MDRFGLEDTEGQGSGRFEQSLESQPVVYLLSFPLELKNTIDRLLTRFGKCLERTSRKKKMVCTVIIQYSLFVYDAQQLNSGNESRLNSPESVELTV